MLCAQLIFLFIVLLPLCYQQKLEVTMELNAQIQRELDEKDEKIRIMEAKNETLRQIVGAKADELELLKQREAALQQEVNLVTYWVKPTI